MGSPRSLKTYDTTESSSGSGALAMTSATFSGSTQSTLQLSSPTTELIKMNDQMSLSSRRSVLSTPRQVTHGGQRPLSGAVVLVIVAVVALPILARLTGWAAGLHGLWSDGRLEVAEAQVAGVADQVRGTAPGMGGTTGGSCRLGVARRMSSVPKGSVNGCTSPRHVLLRGGMREVSR